MTIYAKSPPGLLFLVQIRDRMPRNRDVQSASAPNKTLPVHKKTRGKKVLLTAKGAFCMTGLKLSLHVIVASNIVYSVDDRLCETAGIPFLIYSEISSIGCCCH